MNKNSSELIKELEKQTVEINKEHIVNTPEKKFIENLRKKNEKYFENENIYENIDSIHKEHIKKLSDLVIEELQQKQSLREVSMNIAIVSLVVFGVAIIGLYTALLYRNVEFSDKLLIGITVTMFTAILGLVTIIFKYSFSKTKDVTDYLKDSYIDYKEKE
jgi:hypothetical protein